MTYRIASTFHEKSLPSLSAGYRSAAPIVLIGAMLAKNSGHWWTPSLTPSLPMLCSGYNHLRPTTHIHIAHMHRLSDFLCPSRHSLLFSRTRHEAGCGSSGSVGVKESPLPSLCYVLQLVLCVGRKLLSCSDESADRGEAALTTAAER